MGASNKGKSGNCILPIVTILLFGIVAQIRACLLSIILQLHDTKMQIYTLISDLMHQKPLLNYPSQFALLLALLGIGIILGNSIVLGIGSMIMHVPMKTVPSLLNDPKNKEISQFLNTLASFLVFCLPAIILGKIVNRKPFDYLGFRSRISSKQVLLVVMIAFVGLILSGALGEINQAIPLPAKWLKAAKEAEAKYKESMLAMVSMKSFADYLLAIIVMAVAPAMFEEILFRGALQKVFVGWTRSSFLGIFLASIFFSAIHFSYFGFLPRTALGMILGYVFYYSKNLWYNIFIHFLYNGIIVTQLFQATRKGKQIEKVMDESMPIWMGVIAVLGIFILMRLFKQESDLALHQKSSFENELN
jgi:membrane protease YdiL (CAAX protease family)